MKRPPPREDIWERTSFSMNTRPNRVARDIGRADLILPHGPSKLRMLVMTFAGGIAMAFLYGFPPLVVVAILSPLAVTGAWFWVTLAAVAVCCWATLFTLAVRESAADRRYAEQLHLP